MLPQMPRAKKTDLFRASERRVYRGVEPQARQFLEDRYRDGAAHQVIAGRGVDLAVFEDDREIPRRDVAMLLLERERLLGFHNAFGNTAEEFPIAIFSWRLHPCGMVHVGSE